MCLQVRTAEARHENDFIFKRTLHLTKSTYELSRIYDLEKQTSGNVSKGRYAIS